jgi:predicted metal-dependent enzyme (double-stranded beta helix superfamily)
VALGNSSAIAQRIKADLQTMIATGELRLASQFRETRPDTYARRLLYRDPALRYTAVAMAWGPGQGTRLHDHAGMWCVEGVVEGSMRVTRYDLVETLASGAYRFVEREQVRAEVGSAGSLIPPFEYHVLANALPDRASVTLHIYGGEMTGCHVYERREDDLYEQSYRALGYHD